MIAHCTYHCECSRSQIGKRDPRRQFRRRCLRKGQDHAWKQVGVVGEPAAVQCRSGGEGGGDAAVGREPGHLRERWTRVHELAQEQAELTASKQDVTQRFQEELADAQRMATAMRAALKSHYGPESEKLVEFGIPPFRGRSRKRKEPGAAAAGRSEVRGSKVVFHSGGARSAPPFFCLDLRLGRLSRRSGKDSRSRGQGFPISAGSFPGRRERHPVTGNDSRSAGKLSRLPGNVPFHRAALPGGGQCCPAHRVSLPAPRATLSGRGQRCSADREVLPGRRATLPDHWESFPVVGKPSRSSGALPGGRESLPADGQAIPGLRETLPGPRASLPGAGNASRPRESFPARRESFPDDWERRGDEVYSLPAGSLKTEKDGRPPSPRTPPSAHIEGDLVSREAVRPLPSRRGPVGSGGRPGRGRMPSRCFPSHLAR